MPNADDVEESQGRPRLAALAPAGLTGDGRGSTLVAVAFGWFLTLGARYLVPAVLPQVKDAFQIDNATAGATVTVIWACYALVQFPAGVLGDWVDERRLLAGSLAASALSLGLLAGAPAFAVFLLGAAVYGLGSGLYGPARGMVLARTFRGNDGSAFGVTFAAGSVGSAVLPLAATLLTTTLGWRLGVAVSAPVFVAWAVFTYWAVPVAPREAGDGTSVAEMVDALPRALSRRRVVVSSVAATLMLFGTQAVTAFLVTYLVEAKRLASGTAAALFAAFFLSGAVAQLVAGPGADRFGDRPLLVAGALVGTVSLAALPFLSGLGPLAAVVVAIGARNAIAPINNSYIIASLPESVQGSAWGLLRTGLFLVSATGSTFVGVLADAGRFDAAFLAIAGFTAVAAGLYGVLPDRPSEAVDA